MEALNSPIETGMRVLVLLERAFPESLDLGRLVLLDHGIMHSADLGGPESLSPNLPLRVSEIGIKRTRLELGLLVMLRAGLAEVVADSNGLRYRASEEASNFIDILEADYIMDLRVRASWAVDTFSTLSDEQLRMQMRNIFDSWAEEFHQIVGEDTTSGSSS